jgi:hypothetical protein
LAHPLQDESAVANHAVGPSRQGQGQNRGELGRLLPLDIPGRGSVVVTRRRLRTIDTRAPFDHVEVKLQYAALAENQFGHRDERELGALAEDRAARSEEKVFYQLLRKGRPSANAGAFDIAFRGDLHGVPIESMVLVEAGIFRGDDGMLEIGRDLAERNECVSFVIGRVVNPGLQAALHVNCGGRRVDPTDSHQDQHSKRPKKRRSQGKPSKEGSEKAFPKRDVIVCFWIFSHISE